MFTVKMLSGWDTDPLAVGIPQRVFGELVALAFPIVKHYHSDLYHDAIWLQSHITDNETVTFYFSIRECGTHLTDSAEFIDAVRSVNPDAVIYSVAVMCSDRGRWDIAISSNNDGVDSIGYVSSVSA